MQNHKYKLLLLFVTVFIIASCKKDSQANNHIALTDEDTGKKIMLTNGQTFTLTLSNPGNGGYNFDSPQHNATIIHLNKYNHKAPENGLTGDAGSDIWEFTPTHAGTSILTITATRPWDNGGTVTMFTDTIVVK